MKLNGSTCNPFPKGNFETVHQKKAWGNPEETSFEEAFSSGWERECREKHMTPSSRPLRTVAAGAWSPSERRAALVAVLVLASAAMVLLATRVTSSTHAMVLDEHNGVSHETMEDAMKAAVATRRAAKAARRKLEQLAVERVDRCGFSRSQKVVEPVW